MNTYESLWEAANDAWLNAGKTIPCYEAKYMKARKELADFIEGKKK